MVRGTGLSREKVLAGANEFFEIEALPGGTAADAIARLRGAGSRMSFLLADGAGFTLLRVREAGIAGALAKLSQRQRALDVIVLHKLLLERVIGMSEESIRNQEHIGYVRSAEEALGQVQPREGKAAAEYAFIMNPVRIEQMRDVAFAEEVMPQKSTDFFPKMLTGLTIYSLE